jgi:hypothetical protein
MGIRNIFVLAMLICATSKGIGSTDTGYARVLIIGVIHTGNEQFGYRELAAELERLRPDLILWEQSESFKRVFGIRTAHFCASGGQELSNWHSRNLRQRERALTFCPLT